MTTVPKNPEVYKNIAKFKPEVLNLIDTSVFYEEWNIEDNILERLDKGEYSHSRYLVYRFYPNGYFNVFSFDKNVAIPDIIEVNPDYAGTRGVYYLENNEIRFDEFGGVDELYHTGKITGTFTVDGDKLYIKQDDRKGLDATTYDPDIYIKRKVSPIYFIYKVNWLLQQQGIK